MGEGRLRRGGGELFRKRGRCKISNEFTPTKNRTKAKRESKNMGKEIYIL